MLRLLYIFLAFCCLTLSYSQSSTALISMGSVKENGSLYTDSTKTKKLSEGRYKKGGPTGEFSYYKWMFAGKNGTKPF